MVTKKEINVDMHRCVALHHLEYIDDNLQVNHIDGNKTNNNVENLEWLTASENKRHSVRIGLCDNAIKKQKIRMIGRWTGIKSPNAKMTDELVINLRNDFINGKSQKELREQYNLSKSNVSKIILRQIWNHI